MRSGRTSSLRREPPELGRWQTAYGWGGSLDPRPAHPIAPVANPGPDSHAASRPRESDPRAARGPPPAADGPGGQSGPDDAPPGDESGRKSSSRPRTQRGHCRLQSVDFQAAVPRPPSLPLPTPPRRQEGTGPRDFLGSPEPESSRARPPLSSGGPARPPLALPVRSTRWRQSITFQKAGRAGHWSLWFQRGF